MTITATSLILLLPMESRQKVLDLVIEARDSDQADNFPLEAIRQYNDTIDHIRSLINVDIPPN